MSLSTTALNALHRELGGRLVDFAGWELPVQFTGIIAEHQHTRQSASLFDVSHMGQVLIRPRSGNLTDAAAALETLIPASVAGLAQGRQRYGLFTHSNGRVLDDLMFAHHGDRYFLVVNAARSGHDLELLRTLAGVTVEHLADRSLLALQGPRAEEALAALVPEAAQLKFMDSQILTWDGVEVWVSRSGYTGRAPRQRTWPVPCWSLTGCCRPVSGPATRSGWKRACRCTGMTSAPKSRRLRLTWAGPSRRHGA